MLAQQAFLKLAEKDKVWIGQLRAGVNPTANKPEITVQPIPTTPEDNSSSAKAARVVGTHLQQEQPDAELEARRHLDTAARARLQAASHAFNAQAEVFRQDAQREITQLQKQAAQIRSQTLDSGWSEEPLPDPAPPARRPSCSCSHLLALLGILALIAGIAALAKHFSPAVRT